MVFSVFLLICLMNNELIKGSNVEEIINKSSEQIYYLNTKISELRASLVGKEVPAKLQADFKGFDNALSAYSIGVENSIEIEQMLNSIWAVSIYAQTLAQSLNATKDLSDNLKSFGAEILNVSTELRNGIDNRTVIFNSNENINNAMPKKYPTDELNRVDSNLKAIIDSHNIHDERIKKALSENESRVSLLDTNLKKAEESVTTELEKIKQLYETTLKKLAEKETQMDELLGFNSGRVIAGDFETSAKEERKMADNLRWGSLGIMVCIIIVVGYTFYETTKDNFMWESSIFRISLTFLLSIPAAYLARESAKHRAQQYSHLQTSLDLKAITPYLASLPDEEQHKIKIEIANRIFANKDFSEVSKNAYPLNTQEIIMELIKKFEFAKSDK